MALAIDDSKATVADLRAALGVAELVPVYHGDRELGGDERLLELGLVCGDVLHLGSPGPGRRVSGRTERTLAVVAGVDAGRRTAVTSERTVTIGRDPGHDLAIANETVSSDHAEWTVSGTVSTVRDLGSHNGTWLDGQAVSDAEVESGGRVRMGSSTVALIETSSDDRALGATRAASDESGRILVNRPPRRPLPELADPIEPPALTPERSDLAFSVVAFAVPIVFAGVLVAVMGSWRYALFALLSPVMLLANHLAGRRRLRRQRAGDSTTRAADLERFEADLDGAEAALRRRHAAMAPGIVELRRRIEQPSTRLWERRLDSPDALVVGVGRGVIPWRPAMTEARAMGVRDDEDVVRCLMERAEVDDIEVLADLRLGPLGVVGSDADSAALARSALVQLSTAHGPADVSMVVLTSADRTSRWSWVQWLPHAVDGEGGVLVLSGATAEAYSGAFLDRVRDREPRAGHPTDGPRLLLVVDDVGLLHGRSSAIRRLLNETDRVHGIVLAREEEQLPASTATVVSLGPNGRFEVRHPGRVESMAGSGIADLVSLDTASDIAAALARFEDPEYDDASSSLPASVAGSALFGSLLDGPEFVVAEWQRTRSIERLAAPIGLGRDGVESLDLVADGPHALVAGTTGSGKSELLRTLVAGLALRYGPDDLVFVLLDYKGGSAFDRCAELPHVVGVVTDLDDHLAERALQSLEAELHRRERQLRDHGVGDIAGYGRLGLTEEALPRLVVVIDEFATLRAELPDFVEALVGIAQRGRSLGIHLILATQRPSGAVDANIRANTNLRVALRVQDVTDSVDVIDTRDAVGIDRDRSGRAFLRRGAGDLTEVQTAFVSGRLRRAGEAAVRVAPIPIGSGRPPEFAIDDGEDVGTELDLIVDLVARAHAGAPAPRRPWLEDLPPRMDEDAAVGLPSGDGAPRILAIGDDPARQRRVTLGWDPAEGNLAVYGALGSGVSTLLRSCIVELGRNLAGRRSWVYVSDHGAGGLAGVERHAHVGCRLDESETYRHRRLLNMLESEVTARRDRGRAEIDRLPLVVLVVDGVSGFLDTAGAGAGGPRADSFARIARDGPAVGVVAVVAAAAPGDVPRAMQATIRREFVLELSDRDDYQRLGIRTRTLPSFRPGRALVGPEAQVAQVIVRDDLPPVALDGSEPPPVEELSRSIPAADIEATAQLDPVISVPIGIDDETRDPAFLTIRPGEHALIAGPAGSGRTTAVRQIARRMRAADPDLVLVGVGPVDVADRFAGVGFDAVGPVDEIAPVLAAAGRDARRWVIVVDDADQVRDATGALEELASSGRPGLTLVVTVRSATARGHFGHWTRAVRNSGVGILLDPDNTVDGELLGVRLPRSERLASTPGRGYLVAGGEIRTVQLAH